MLPENTYGDIPDTQAKSDNYCEVPEPLGPINKLPNDDNYDEVPPEATSNSVQGYGFIPDGFVYDQPETPFETNNDSAGIIKKPDADTNYKGMPARESSASSSSSVDSMLSKEDTVQDIDDQKINKWVTDSVAKMQMSPTTIELEKKSNSFLQRMKNKFKKVSETKQKNSSKNFEQDNSPPKAHRPS